MQRETEREIIIIFFVECFDGTSENLLHSLICFVYAFIFGRFIFHSFRIVKLTNHFSPISDEVMANTYTARRRRESNRKCLFHCLESALGENSAARSNQNMQCDTIYVRFCFGSSENRRFEAIVHDSSVAAIIFRD